MQRISLAPVDGVHVTILMDNSADWLLADETGLVRRWGLDGTAGPLPVIPHGASIGVRGTGFVVPAHCTSWNAHQALAEGLPGSYRPNAVVSRYEL